MSLKEVVLIGDSIRMAYQPLVADALEGKVSVWGPEQNGGDSANVLAYLQEWVIARRPDLVHINCGLHDLKVVDGAVCVPLEDYVHNVHEMMDRLLAEFDGEIIWATTTPVIDGRHQSVKPFERHEEDVLRYNAAALAIMESHDVLINDLHAVIIDGGPDLLLGTDGVHMIEAGNRQLAGAVARAVGSALEQPR